MLELGDERDVSDFKVFVFKCFSVTADNVFVMTQPNATSVSTSCLISDRVHLSVGLDPMQYFYRTFALL